MKAYVVRGPSQGATEHVAEPVAGPGEAVAVVERVGLCGTDRELFEGAMLELHQGQDAYPLRLGHEWVGRVESTGPGVGPEWLGRRVTGDCMIGCGHCGLCRRGAHYVCPDRLEVGVRGRDGALAERLVLPVSSLIAVPEELTAAAGAMIEPGGNAWRAVDAAQASPSGNVLIWGAGTIGLLCVMFAKAAGSEVEVVARRQASAEAAERAGADRIWQPDEVPRAGGANWNGYSAVIEASGAASAPGRCAMSVEPGGRLVLIGVAGQASLIDTRHLVTNDITAIGILGGSLGLRPALAAYGSRDVIPDSLVSQVISLDQVSQAFAAVTGQPKPGAPKVQVNPSL